MEFSIYLKSCREKHFGTQDQLVNALYRYDSHHFKNLDSVTLSRWERNTTKPNTLKQLSIIKYFQKQIKEALPCWNHYSIDEVEHLICTVGMKNILGKSQQLILNFPAELMQMDDLKVYPVRNMEKSHKLFEINMDFHKSTNERYTQISLEQFEKWSQHPSSFFIACEYKEDFAGLFFCIRLKVKVFEKLKKFQIQKCDIEESDFAKNDEVGAVYMLSFYALNYKVATMLFVRYYAYLIARQNKIEQIGVTTALPEVKKAVENMNLELVNKKYFTNGKSLVFYSQSLDKVLATDYVVKMIFSQ